MEAIMNLRNPVLIVGLVLVTLGTTAQEYDDLYFTSKDRKKVEKLEEVQNQSANTYQAYSNNTYADNYSTHNVNPEYIAKYQSEEAYPEEELLLDENQSYAQPSMSNVAYYPEEADYSETYTDPSGTTVVNNYYGNQGYWQTDPWMSSSLYYDPFWGWSRGFYTMGTRGSWRFNMRFGWGGPWMYNDPFWGSYYYSPYYVYDPFWGFSSFYPAYGYGCNFWNTGYYNYTWYDSYSSPSRNVVVGSSRPSRGGTLQRTNATNSRVNTANARSSTESRDFSRTQNEYYSRSRSSSTGRVTSTASDARGRSGYTGSSSSRYSTGGTSSSRQNPSTYSNRSRTSSGTTYSNGTSSSSRRYSSGSTYSNSSNRSYSSSGTRSSSSGSSYSGTTRSSSSYSGTRSSSSSSSYSGSRSSSGYSGTTRSSSSGSGYSSRSSSSSSSGSSRSSSGSSSSSSSSRGSSSSSSSSPRSGRGG